MKLKAEILATEKFEIEGKKFVRIQGFINDLGIFKHTVKEEIVPDVLEGRKVTLNFEAGLDKSCKIYSKLVSISLDNEEKNADSESVPY